MKFRKNKTILNIEAKKRLIESTQLNPETLFEKYHSSLIGQSEENVEIMRETYGRNEMTLQKKDSTLKLLFEAFINPFTIILFILAFVSYISDVLMASGSKDYSAVIIVTLMVFISGFLRFFQDKRSNDAAEKLNDMVETTIAVTRQETGRKEIPIDELTTGDIIHLGCGDMIPADMRIIQAKDLFISQSSLTGESEAVEKFPNISDIKSSQPLDHSNLAFMGSNVVSGSGIGIIINVGDDTTLGSLTRQISEKSEPTSFEKGINKVSMLLIRFMVIMVLIVFLVNGAIKGNWFEAFMFALSIAVGLTPEMLPMIVTTNLALGATKMAKHKVIVKNVNTIQNFGAMDILCADKTGTLTKDKIVLEYSLDIHGNEDQRTLRHAFLNSYYQTGLKNIMDHAIIDHSNEMQMHSLKTDYIKIDELPFDFTRRRMSIAVKDKSGKAQMITKGAVEEMLSISSFVEYKGQVLPLTEAIKNEILTTVKNYNDQGMRVLAVAQKNEYDKTQILKIEDEKDMVLIGYLAFLDPPKETSKAAIKTLMEHGVDVKVLTGDNEAVTRYICNQVGIDARLVIIGHQIETMNEEDLDKIVKEVNVFTKLSPEQKARIVKSLQKQGHTIGFMGDGINDSLALKQADVGISVDSAVDIAKETADIILMEKDLMVLENGVIEGRKTYANIIKYIKMTASSNFGNMLSVLVASILLPFLPMIPIQILVLNLIYDISCISIPWDNVDHDYLKIPRKWDASSIKHFMVWLGPVSSIFDILTYLLMYFIICPQVYGGSFHTLNVADQTGFIALFHSGWFVLSLWSQTLVIHLIRTSKTPFIESRASLPLTLLTSLGIIVGTILPFTPIGTALDMQALPIVFFGWLILLILGYMILTTFVKNKFINRYKELL